MTRKDAGVKKKRRGGKKENQSKRKGEDIKNARKNEKENPTNTRYLKIFPTVPPPDNATDAHPATSLFSEHQCGLAYQ
jgi:hypothetical protein